VLDVAKQEALWARLKERLAAVYGQVLIGYGPDLETGKPRNYFLIGPESQFQSLEELIRQSEGAQPVYRLYPRDYWITAGGN
jgi:hypothetical protein